MAGSGYGGGLYIETAGGVYAGLIGYGNSGLATIHGNDAVHGGGIAAIERLTSGTDAAFEVDFISAHADQPVALTENFASAKGGAIYLRHDGHDAPSLLNLENHVRIERNIAPEGAALYLGGGQVPTRVAPTASRSADRRRLGSSCVSERDAHRRRRARGTGRSVAPYLWPAAEIAYLCRLRGIEVVCELSDANVTEVGLLCVRRKGSLPNVTRWDERLRAAHTARIAYRNERWSKKKRAVPLRPEGRPLVVGTSGEPITKSAFNSAWHRMIRAAITDGAIAAEDRFSMHDLKRRGVTDTAGTRGEKQQASGHRAEAMLDVYDQDVPIVDSAASSRAKKPVE